MVDHYGKYLSQLFKILTEWNTYLESEFHDVFPMSRMIGPES